MGILAASFPGIDQIQRVHLSCGYGRNVIAVVDMLPQFGVPAANGTLALTDGIVSLFLTDCRVSKAHLTISTSGHIVRCVILGRVWRWRYGEVTGAYNVRLSDGSIDPDTEKTPQQLAAICFQAMNEPVFDVGQLPNGDRPQVNWYGTPAESALTWLCNLYGCDFGLDIALNAGRIWRLGVGSPLPAGGQVMSVGYGIDVGEPPDFIKIFCGPTLFQLKFALEPVLEDSDGTIKHADDVAYVPAGGWEGTDPEDPLGPDADPASRARARRLWKDWRITGMADGTLNIPFLGPVASVKDMLPVFDILAESYDSDTGTFEQSAYLVGTFAVSGEPPALTNSDPHELWESPHTLDSETGIVHLTVPAFKYVANKTTEAATLYLVASCYLRAANTYNFDAYTLTRQIASNGTGAMPLHRSELHGRVVASYPADPADDTEGQTATGITNNQAELDAILNLQIDAVQTEFQTVNTEVRHYIGLMPFTIDGALRQYRLLIDMNRGCSTIIAFNTEWEPGILTRAVRVRNAQVRHDRSLRESNDHRNRRLARKGVR